jgi:hypothetical protein
MSSPFCRRCSAAGCTPGYARSRATASGLATFAIHKPRKFQVAGQKFRPVRRRTEAWACHPEERRRDRQSPCVIECVALVAQAA